MSNSKPHQKKTAWQESLLTHADSLETQAHSARLIATAETHLDGAAVACDLLVAAHHTEAARRARISGRTPPAPTAPVSKLLTQFAEALRDKLAAVGALLSDSERARLAAIAPRALERLEAQDDDVREMIVQLLPQPPAAIALWLALHVRRLEVRFAS